MDVWKWFRRGAYSVAALVALVVVALVVALLLIDTEMLKRQLETRVEAQTGRELQIEGSLDISFYPVLGFEVQDVQLANAPGFGDEPFVAFDRALLRARVLPLLTGKVVVDTVRLHGLRVNAARDAEDRTNWDDLIDAGQAQADAPAESSAPGTEQTTPAADEDGAPVNLSVDRIEVRDSRFAWSDAVSGQELRVSNFALTVRSLQWDNPATVALEGQLHRGDDPPLAMHAITRLSWDPATPSVTLDNLDINVLSEGGMLPAGLSAQLRGDLHVDAAQGVAKFERVAFRVFGRAVTRGDVIVRFGEGTPSFEGQLEVEPFNPAAVAKAGGWPLPERADGDTLTQASLSLQFAGDTEAVTVESLEGRLDDTAFSGQARARLAEIPSVEFSLNADAIDLDRYLPPRDSGDASDNGSSSDSGSGDGDGAGGDPIAQLPLEALQGINGQGEITLGRLQWRGLPMEDIRVQAQLADGVLDLTRADLRVAGGRVAASGRLDGSDVDRPAARLQAQLSEIRSEPVLTAVLDRALVTGTLNASTELATAGATLDDWIGALDGKLQARFADGTIAGINIAQRLRVAVARLRDGEEAQAAQERSTDFSSLQISATINDGVVRSNDLDLRTPLLQAGGAGRANLPKHSLDYTLRLRVTDAAREQGGRLADLAGTEVPLRFSGQLTSPSIDLALGDALEQRAKQEIEQEKQEAEKRARRELKEEGEKVEERLERELKGLFE